MKRSIALSNQITHPCDRPVAGSPLQFLGTSLRWLSVLMICFLLWAWLFGQLNHLPVESGHISKFYGKQIPTGFETLPTQSAYVLRGRHYDFLVEPRQASFIPHNQARSGQAIDSSPATERPRNLPLRMQFLGASKEANLQPRHRMPGRINYLIGKDPRKWRTGIAAYQAIEGQQLYPGVDVVYYQRNGELEHDLIIAPGACVDAVQMYFPDAGGTDVTSSGQLRVRQGESELCLSSPLVYQEIAGKRILVAGAYRRVQGAPIGREIPQLGNNGKDLETTPLVSQAELHSATAPAEAEVFTIEVGKYDHAYPLIIDPVLVYSSYLGGVGRDLPEDIKLDAAGNIYVTGETASVNFPVTPGAFDTNPDGVNSAITIIDAFVTKLDPTGTQLIYSTFVGGTDNDEAHSVEIGDDGCVYVSGSTSSGDFPTVNAFQPTESGRWDAFLFKLDPSGSQLVFSTFLGGAGDETMTSLAIYKNPSDGLTYPFVYFTTLSTNLATPGGFRPTYSGGMRDCYIAKMNPSGSGLVYASYLGGSRQESILAEGHYNEYALGNSIAVDASGAAYVTGWTESQDFPVTPGALLTTTYPDVDRQAFVSKISPNGSALVYSTYLGGRELDQGSAIVVDGSGYAYVVGTTWSNNFPLVNPAQTRLSGGYDAFISKLNPDGGSLLYSTYLGGLGHESGNGIALDASGAAWITGTTASSSYFPLISPVQFVFGGDFSNFDAFVTRLSPSGSSFTFSTYLGGTSNENGAGIDVSQGGDCCVVCGPTNSIDFPTVAPLQAANASDWEGFVVKLGSAGQTPVVPGKPVAQIQPGPAVLLTWSDNSANEDSFLVERKVGNGGYFNLGLTASNVPSYADTDVTVGNTYTYRIRAINGFGVSSASGETALTVAQPLSPPSDLIVSGLTPTAVTLSWLDNTSQEEGFEIQRQTSGSSFVVVGAVGANQRSYADSGLMGATVYVFRVRAIANGQVSAFSNEVAVTTPPERELAPSNLSAGVVSSSEIRLTWKDNSISETGFKIERKVSGGAFAQLVIAPAQPGTGEMVIYTDVAGLSPNTGYVYRVRAAGPVGDSTYSNEASVSTSPRPPSAPSALTLTLTSPSAITLTWTDNSTNETGFKIERRAGNDNFTFIGQAPADTHTFPDAGLAGDTLYTYRVRASGNTEDSANSNEAALSTPPSAPTGLTVSATVPEQITLNWTDTSVTETGFKIERKTGSSFAPVGTASANSTSYTDSVLTPHTSYRYRVRASNAGGDSAYSGEAVALTLPTAPTALVVTVLSSAQLELNWTDNNPSPPVMKVERSADGDNNFVQVGSTAGGVTRYRDSNLSPLTSYHYRVRASNATGNSGYSAVASGVTFPPLPAAPSGLTAVALNASAVQLNWQDNSTSETGFEVQRIGPAGGYILLTTTGSNASRYLDSMAQGSTTYSYRIRAVNEGGVSSFTGAVNVTTPAQLPPIPGGVTASPISSQQIWVTWSDTSNLETGFRVERKEAGGAFGVVTTTAGNATEYLDTGLVEGSAYTYRIFAIGNSGNSAASGEVTATTFLGPPTGLVATAAVNRINVSWQDGSTHEGGFQIERRSAGGSFAALASVGVSVTTYADTTTAAGTLYTYRVKATGGTNGSIYSNESSAIPLNVTPLAKLVITPTKVNFGTVRVGANKLKALKVTNKGKEPLSISVGAVSAPFAVMSGGGTTTLAPKQSLKITLRYAPTSTGAASAPLRITSTVPARPQVDLALTGKGK